MRDQPRGTQEAGSGWGPFLLTSMAVVLFLAPTWSNALAFDRQAVVGGEWWRLITGHWVHYAWSHLIWDGLVFLGLSTLLMQRRATRTLWFLVAVHGVLAAGLMLLPPFPEHYRGLSGIDAGLYTMTAGLMWRAARARKDTVLLGLAWVLLGAFFGKCAYEMWTGSAIFVADVTKPPLLSAHFLGGVTGLIFAPAPRSGNPSP